MSRLFVGIDEDDDNFDQYKEGNDSLKCPATLMSCFRIADEVTEAEKEVQDNHVDDFVENLHVIVKVSFQGAKPSH